MAQNKLEIQIKEKLNSREIKPTEMAWDRLDAMLSVAEEKKTKRFPFLTFRSIGIAASILVFLSVGMLYLNQENTHTKSDNPIVVKDEIKIDNSKDNNLIPTVVDEQVAETINNNPQKINQKSSKSFNQNNNQKTEINPLINKNKKIEFLTNGDVAQKDLPKVISQEDIVLPKKVTVNVDDLLASVENQSKNAKTPMVKVNANSLLSQVDGELELTFRQKAINRISKNYQEVKVALANRNKE